MNLSQRIPNYLLHHSQEPTRIVLQWPKSITTRLLTKSKTLWILQCYFFRHNYLSMGSDDHTAKYTCHKHRNDLIVEVCIECISNILHWHPCSGKNMMITMMIKSLLLNSCYCMILTFYSTNNFSTLRNCLFSLLDWEAPNSNTAATKAQTILTVCKK